VGRKPKQENGKHCGGEGKGDCRKDGLKKRMGTLTLNGGHEQRQGRERRRNAKPEEHAGQGKETGANKLFSGSERGGGMSIKTKKMG